MANNQKIAWKRISVEAAAIVVSILFAFAIDAWWADRQRLIEERSVLLSLYPEVQELVRLVDRYEIYIDALRDATRRTYNASASSKIETSDAEIDQHLIEIGWYIEPSIANAPVLESLVKGGGLEVVSSGELRLHMVNAMALLDAYKEEVSRDSDFYNGALLPFLQAHASLGQVYSQESHEPGLPERVYPSYNVISPDVYSSNRAVFENQEFRNLLLHRITTTTNILLWQQSDLEPELKALTSLIENELGIESEP